QMADQERNRSPSARTLAVLRAVSARARNRDLDEEMKRKLMLRVRNACETLGWNATKRPLLSRAEIVECVRTFAPDNERVARLYLGDGRTSLFAPPELGALADVDKIQPSVEDELSALQQAVLI